MKLPQVHRRCDNASTGIVVIGDPLQEQSVTLAQDAIVTLCDTVFHVLHFCMLFHWSIAWIQMKQGKCGNAANWKSQRLIPGKKN